MEYIERTRRGTAKFLMGLGLMVVAWASVPAPVGATDVGDAEAVPHIDDKARDGYRVFLSMPHHRAFAIAPGGAWGWSDSEASRERAEAAALKGCERYTDERCIVYTVNDDVVLDRAAWARLWRPFLDHAGAAAAPTGVKPGQRFPDLAFSRNDGSAGTVSGLRGKVLLLHFWGTWCTYCQPELEELQALHDALAASDDFEFVLLQVRESIDVTRRWLDEKGFTLPQYDSGVSGADQETLRLSDGGPIRDRELARAFPTTYILDGRGIVVFRRIGPALRWQEYIPLLKDVAGQTAG